MASSRLFPTRVWDFTAALAGLLPVMPLDLSLYVSPGFRFIPHDLTNIALWWFRFCQGVHLWPEGLQQGQLGPELRCLHLRCQCLSDRFGSPGRDQDPYPEPQLREPRVGIPHRRQHAQERGPDQLLQGSHAQATDDRTQACFQLLAGSDVDSCVRPGRIKEWKFKRQQPKDVIL